MRFGNNVRCKRELQGWSSSCEACHAVKASGASCVTTLSLTDLCLLLHACAVVNKTFTTTAGDVIALYAAAASNSLLSPPYKYKTLNYTPANSDRTLVSASVT